MTGPGHTAPEEWRRTSPLSFVVTAILSLRRAGLPTLAALIGTGAFRQGWAVVVPALVAMGLLTALFSFLAWRKFRYRLGESDIRVERGLFSRTARSVPYERIQDVSLEQGLVARLFGMVEVRFETGAGGKDEVRVRYVSAAEAEALRETVRVRLDDSVPASGASDAVGDAAPPLFAMDLARLATFGLFEFSLVAFVALAGAAQQFGGLLPIDIWSYRAWATLLGEPAHALQYAGPAIQIVGATLALAVLATVGLATGFVRTALRDYGFRLEPTPKGLRRRRGLLTRSDVVMPVHRVQALQLGSGIVRRRFGWHELSVVSLAQDAKSGHHVVVPFGRIAEIAPVVAATGFALPGAQTAWQRPSRAYLADRTLLALLPLGLGALALAANARWVLPGAPERLAGFAALAVLAGLIVARAWARWHSDCHAVDARVLYARHGWLVPHLDIAAPVKLQSVEIVQGPIARRRGYADLNFGLAGGKLAIAGVPLAEALAIRTAVLDRIAGVDFRHA